MLNESPRRCLVATLLVVAMLVGSARSVAALPQLPIAPTTVGGYCADAEENAFLGLINQYRAANGLGALAHTQTLAAAAEHHSVDMATNNYFSHPLLDGTSVAQNIANHGYPDRSTWGENIAAGNASAAATFEQWRTSPPHNANMLNASFGAIGIGRASGASSGFGTYWTTVFGATNDGTAIVCGESAPEPVPAQPTSPPAPPVPSQPAQPPPADVSANATTTAALNLRNGAGLTALVLTVMPEGTRVAITGAAQSGFAPVQYGGIAGWASTDFLAIDGQTAPEPVAPDPGPSQGTTTVTEDLNLRAGPTTASTILAVMPAGTILAITGTADQGFLPVNYDGVAGWAYSAYLSTGGTPAGPAPAAPTAGGGTSTVTDDLNLRSTASLDSAVLTMMPTGATVTLTGGSDNGFVSVRYGGIEGWAWAAYLSAGGTSAPTSSGTTTTTDLNLRTGASLYTGVVLVMPPGAVVQITGANTNGFVPVTYNGTSGWAFAAYLA